jgi:hypothetical protein
MISIISVMGLVQLLLLLSDFIMQHSLSVFNNDNTAAAFFSLSFLSLLLLLPLPIHCQFYSRIEF